MHSASRGPLATTVSAYRRFENGKTQEVTVSQPDADVILSIRSDADENHVSIIIMERNESKESTIRLPEFSLGIAGFFTKELEISSSRLLIHGSITGSRVIIRVIQNDANFDDALVPLALESLLDPINFTFAPCPSRGGERSL